MSSFQEPQLPASYIIYKETVGTVDYYFAQNGRTGAIDYGGQNVAGGVDGTDASAVIQAATNALTSGGKVFVKEGIYWLSSSIELKSGISLVGVAPGKAFMGTMFRASLGFSGALIKTPAISDELINSVGIMNLKLDGQNETGVTTLLNLDNVDTAFITQCVFTKSPATALKAGFVGVLPPTGALVPGMFWIKDNIFSSISGVGIDLEYHTQTIIRRNVFFGGGTTTRCIRIFDGNKVFVVENEMNEYTDIGIYLTDDNNPNTRDCIITNNFLNSTQTGARGIVENGNGDRQQIIANSLINNPGGKIVFVGAKTEVSHNRGYVVANSGTATIPPGATSIDVPHGLAITPDINKIDLTPKDNLAGRSIWVEAHPTAPGTYFVIKMDNEDAVNHVFGWSYGE